MVLKNTEQFNETMNLIPDRRLQKKKTSFSAYLIR